MPRQRLLLPALVLALLGGACAGRTEALPTPVPAPKATADERVAVLSSGRPSPPPVPTVTPVPPPTCAPGAIWWFEARYRDGQTVTLQGPVVEAEGTAALSLGQRAADPNRLRLVSPGAPLPASLLGRTVCATGTVRVAAGVPALQLADASAVRVVP